jgi:integrase
MGYAVKPATSKKRPFKLLFETSTFIDGKRVKKAPAIPFVEWGVHGFHPKMTLEEARATASRLNKNAEEKRHAANKVKIGERLESEARALESSFPNEAAFLDWCLEEHRVNIAEGKLSSHWMCTKRLIAALKLSPPDYYARRRRIYGWFISELLSVDYVKKLLRFVNLYGEWHAETFKVYFKRVPYPTGRDRQDVANAHRKKKEASKKSKPLTPEMLEAVRDKFTEEEYRWLFLTVWAGLRPEEADSLVDEEKAYLSSDDDGVNILHVYQSKLERSVEEENRWKLIPLFLPEQSCVAAYVRDRRFERPSVSRLHSVFGEGVHAYAGRKGFEALMERKEQPFHYYSAWLGHQNINMTWKKYRDRKVARYKKAA